MESLLVNALIGFWLILFGGMAILPFMLQGKPARKTPFELEDDLVISIEPVATSQTARRPLTPVSIPTRDRDQREAA